MIPDSPGRVDVWQIPLDRTPAQLAESLPLLSGDELSRAERFVHSADRVRWTASRVALRVILSDRLGLVPSDVRFAVDSSGKPRFDPLAHKAEIHFNLSHSDDLALLAVTAAAPVGIDVERMRSFPEAMAVAQQQFTPEESAELSAMDKAESQLAFFRCWTRKEACLKALGTGLSFRLKTTPNMCREHAPSHVEIADWPEAAVPRLQLHSIDCPPGYLAALAIQTWRACRVVMSSFAWDSSNCLAGPVDGSQPSVDSASKARGTA